MNALFTPSSEGGGLQHRPPVRPPDQGWSGRHPKGCAVHPPSGLRGWSAVGGKHKPSDVTDDRHQMYLEPMIDFERARWLAIEAEWRGEPSNPF